MCIRDSPHTPGHTPLLWYVLPCAELANLDGTPALVASAEDPTLLRLRAVEEVAVQVRQLSGRELECRLDAVHRAERGRAHAASGQAQVVPAHGTLETARDARFVERPPAAAGPLDGGADERVVALLVVQLHQANWAGGHGSVVGDEGLSRRLALSRSAGGRRIGGGLERARGYGRSARLDELRLRSECVDSVVDVEHPQGQCAVLARPVGNLNREAIERGQHRTQVVRWHWL
eukprot:7236728-Prymnesium_polylepis.1